MKRNVLLAIVALCTLASQPAWSQSNVGFQRGGIALSMVSPENIDATLGLGVFADLGTIAPRWGLEGRLDWWSHSEDFFGADVSMSDITLGARTKYNFPTKSNLQPFAGAGLGIHFLSMEVGLVDPFTGLSMGTADASETRVGVDVGGGFSTSLSARTNLLAEGWFSLVSDFDQFALRVGLSQAFGN